MDAITSGNDRASLPLNILFVSGFDSGNHTLVPVVRELTRRGHACTVVSENPGDAVNNKVFSAAGIEIVPLADVGLNRLSEFDIAFSGPFVKHGQRRLFESLASARVFLVSFANLFTAVTMRVPADLVVVPSVASFDEFGAHGFDYTMVAAGNPQYDILVRERESWQRERDGTIRRVLVVDQGAYPFGQEGQQQLAAVLVALARHHPDVSIRVKLRYLPGEEGDHLHSLSEHFLEWLGECPDNLELLGSSTGLEEEMLASDAMVALWSTSHLAAAVLGMPLMLLSGFDSVDVFDVRRQRVEAAYATLKQTGCVVDWRDAVQSGLRFGTVDPGYTARAYDDVDALSAPRVAQLVEILHERVLSRGRALGRGLRLPWHEFVTSLCSDRLELVDASTEQHRLERLLYRRLNEVLQQALYDSRCLGTALDLSELAGLWHRTLPELATDKDVAQIVCQAEDAVLALKSRYFHAHPQSVASDSFVQDQYFDWLAETEPGALLDYQGPLVAPESLKFNQGKVLVRRLRLIAAGRRFVDSFACSMVKPVRVMRKDKNVTVIISRAHRSLLAHAIVLAMDAYGARDALSAMEVPTKPGFESLLLHKARALKKLGRGSEARRLVRAFAMETGWRSPIRRHGFRGLVLQVLHAAYRAAARRYATRLM